MNNLDILQKNIKYAFNDLNTLKIALTHSSYANENNVENYERLEFLGDAVIELVVSDYIYKNCSFDAGISSKLRASLVSTENLYSISKELLLDKMVLKSKSLSNLSKKNTADLFESLIGAVYIDGGISPAKEIIQKFVIVSDENIKNKITSSIDYKTKFQEYMQSKGIRFEYKLIASEGMDHDKTFECGLYVNNELFVTAKGKSIQSAEEKCAEKYFEKDL